MKDGTKMKPPNKRRKPPIFLATLSAAVDFVKALLSSIKTNELKSDGCRRYFANNC